jgi:hypothetical protein
MAGFQVSTEGCENRLLLELVVADPIVAREHHPPVNSRITQPNDVLCTLRKQIVMHADVEAGASQGIRHLLTAQRTVDEEYERLRRPAPAGARNGPLLRC